MSWAVPANPSPWAVVLPDGDTLVVVSRGDEFSHWVETLDGRIVLQDTDGYYKYATVVNGTIVPSSVVARSSGTAARKAVIRKQDDQSDVRAVLGRQRDEAVRIHAEPPAGYDMSDSLTVQYLRNNAPAISRAAKNPHMGTTGTKRILVVLADFLDIQFTTPEPRTKFHNLMN